MKRIYKGSDLEFNLTINNVPVNSDLIDFIEFRFYTINTNNFIVKTKKDISQNTLILEWKDLSKLEQGVLFYDYKISTPDSKLSDGKFDEVKNVMTNYFIVTEKESINIDTPSSINWGNIQGNIIDQKDLIDYIDNIELSGSIDLTPYAKKSELPTKVSQLENDKNYLSEHQSLAGYAKETWVTQKITDAQLSGGEVDLTPYAKKSEVNPKIESIQTQINQIIATSANLKLTVDPDLIYKGVSTVANINVVLEGAKGQITLFKNDVQLKQSGISENLLSVTDTINDITNYKAEVTINDNKITSNATVSVVDPVYVGSGNSYTEVAVEENKQSIRTTANGYYKVSVTQPKQKVYFIIPNDMDFEVSRVTLYGFLFPMSLTGTQTINDRIYKVYESNVIDEVIDLTIKVE